MSSVAPKFSTTLSLSEMEVLIRRVVKEAVHEELTFILRLTLTRSWRIGATRDTLIPKATACFSPKR